MRVSGTRQSVVLATAGNLSSPVVLLLTAPLLARTLGVTGRGEVAAGAALLLVASAVGAIGLPSAVTYFVSRERSGAVHYLVAALLLAFSASVPLMCVLFAVAPTLSDGNETLHMTLTIAILFVGPTILASLLRATVIGLGGWRYVVREQAFAALLEVLLLGVLALTDSLTTTTAIIALCLTPLFGTLVYLPVMRTMRGTFARPAVPAAKALGGYGVRVWIGAISGIFLQMLDQVLMSPLANAHELGIYAVAATISQIPLLVTNSIRDVIFASDSYRQDLHTLLRASRASTFISALMFAATVLAAPFLIPLIFGGDFRAATLPAIILGSAMVVGSAGSVIGAGLSARGYPGRRSVSLVVACLVNLVLLFPLVPSFGAVGAAIATCAGTLVAGQLNVYQARRVVGNISYRSAYVPSLQDVRSLSGLRRQERSLRKTTSRSSTLEQSSEERGH